jgi:large subunit ribosomal protein L2
MSLKFYNPVTPSLRQLVTVNKSELYSGKPYKPLTEGIKSSGGRNNSGRVTVRFRGGGHKRVYRTIDFKRQKYDVPAIVVRIEYDPCRSAFIGLVRYEDGMVSYILMPQRLSVGDAIISGERVDVKPGNAMFLKNIPVGTVIHNVELKIGKGAQLARSAGSYAQVSGKTQEYVIIKLSSGEQRLIHGNCFATVGAVSNPSNSNINLGKAGRSRWLGRRPHNRGVSMNPIDHPHGGGEGRTSGGRHPVTPWGKNTKGKKTRRNKFTSKMILNKKSSGR